MKNSKDLTKRTLYYFWMATKKKPGFFLLDILTTFGYVALLTYVNNYLMGRVVDRVGSQPVAASEVFHVFWPYILSFVVVNALGQVCSKLQDYSVWKLEIKANYELATYCFDTLSNQSMTFHANRYGGSLVSQTTKFMSAYTLLAETVTYSVMPSFFSVLLAVIFLMPTVPLYVLILLIMLTIYVIVAYTMYKRILPINEKAASAQNSLSGELSDAVANILSVKTYGREDYEKELFEIANKNVEKNDSIRMRASNIRGAMTSSLIVFIMIIVVIFIVGGNAWFGISPGTLIMMFTYTYSITLHFNN